MSYWDYYKKTPKRVKNGYQTKNKRGSFTKTWYSRLWLYDIKNSSDIARMGRGRSYVRKGQISDIKIRLSEIQGKVQGTRSTPYNISIKFPHWKKKQWNALISDIALKPNIYLLILDGEFPNNLESYLINRSFFYSSIGKLKYKCSCPDWGKPCKHVAALIYALIEIIDDDPFIMFLIRGLKKQNFIDILKETYNSHVFNKFNGSQNSKIVGKIDDNTNREVENYLMQKISNFMEKEINSHNKLNSTNEINGNYYNFFHIHQTSEDTIDDKTKESVVELQNTVTKDLMNTWIGNLKEEMEKTDQLVNSLMNHIKTDHTNSGLYYNLISSKKIFNVYEGNFYDSLTDEKNIDNAIDLDLKNEFRSPRVVVAVDNHTKQKIKEKPKQKVEENPVQKKMEKNKPRVEEETRIRKKKEKVRISSKEIINELKEIKGVGPKTARELYNFGIKSLEDLAFKVEKVLNNNIIPNKKLLTYSKEAKSILNRDSNRSIESAVSEIKKKKIINALCNIEGMKKEWANILYKYKITNMKEIALIGNFEYYRITHSHPSIQSHALDDIINKSILQLMSKNRKNRNVHEKRLYDNLLNSSDELLGLSGIGPKTLKILNDSAVHNLLDLALITEDCKLMHDHVIPTTILKGMRSEARSYIVESQNKET